MKRQKECFIGVSAVVHLFLKIAGAMPVVFLLFLVVNVLHGTAWALETLARQVFFDGLQSAVERNSLQAAYSGALWVGAAAVYVQVLNGAGNFIGQHIFNPRAVNTLTREFHTQTAQLPLYEFEKETTLETNQRDRAASQSRDFDCHVQSAVCGVHGGVFVPPGSDPGSFVAVYL